MAGQNSSPGTIRSATILATPGARQVNQATPASAQSQTTHSSLSTHFSQSQIALALSIQKSRPEGVSVIEYCQQLRNSIRDGQADKDPRYVDSADFWKDQYSKIHLENKALQDKVLRLEEEQRLIRESIDHGDDQYGEPSLVQELLAQSYATRSRNSRKRQAPDDVDWWIEDQQNQEMKLPSCLDDSSLRLNSYVFRIARQRIALEKLVEDFKDEYREDATKQSLQILNLLELALSDSCLPLSQVKTIDETPQLLLILQQLMHQITLGFATCFEALNHICRNIIGRTRMPELVYGMVMFFNRALAFLQTIIDLQTEQAEEQNRRRMRNKTAKSDEGEYAVNKYLAWVLTSIFSKLGWKAGKPGHSELLEGFLFSILEHTGRLLSEAVFNEHVAKSTNPGNISQGKTSPNLATAKIESRYIVQILHACFGTPEKKELAAKVLAYGRKDLDPLRRTTSSAPSSSFTQNLVTKSKILIQGTLIKCTIGGDNLPSLRLPASLAEEVDYSVEAANHIETGSREWLVENVWALIGWDTVLEKD